ncbi:MAG: Eco57I restriction-modification methylase domain-containing protein, partial [Terriglobia bacterium]
YYTPTYIVDYIVKQTVGKLLEGSTPDKAAKLKILDPACGSGSFLLGAFQCLLDWHRDWYSANDPEKHARGRPPRIFKGPGGSWRLTTAERKRILLKNIFGVDIDPQAVEVTKLSLLLKVLEEESGETLNKNWEMFHERALPDLDNNIKCGNSLIGPDYFEGRLALDDDERRRINPFNWDAEFPDIVKRKGLKESGGFDVVLGNPPYVRMEEFKEIKEYLKREYACHDERSDLYAYFIERSHHLLNARGRFGMIVSNKFLRANYGKPLRDFLGENAGVEQVVDFAGLPVFQGATVRTIVLITTRAHGENACVLYFPPVSAAKFVSVEGSTVSVEKAVAGNGYALARTTLKGPVWSFAEPAREVAPRNWTGR